MRGIEKYGLGQTRYGAASVVRRDDSLAERRLVQALFDCPEGISAFGDRFGGRNGRLVGVTKRDLRLKCSGVPSN